LAHFGNKKLPACFNNTPVTRCSHKKDLIRLQGRILPKTEPYCRASFLIEITFPREYPFKPPEMLFLDPVYHPNVDERGCSYCCWEHLLWNETYKPTTSVKDLIEAFIRNFDSLAEIDQAMNTGVASEYRTHPEIF
jgi:ubiquitin-conjugating enzyme E2 L3